MQMTDRNKEKETTMDIENLTIKQARELAALFSGVAPTKSDDSHWPVGKPVFIRTVTHHLTGILVAVTPHELVLDYAAWIADDGRFADALAKGEFAEVEPFPSGRRVLVGRGALIDATEIATAPRSQK